jgi:hypothetical protein
MEFRDIVAGNRRIRVYHSHAVRTWVLADVLELPFGVVDKEWLGDVV